MSKRTREFNLIFERPDGTSFYKPLFLGKDLNHFLFDERYHLESDLYSVATGIFELEKVIKTGTQIKSLKIPISTATNRSINSTEVENHLNQIFRFITSEDVNFKLIPRSIKRIQKPYEINDNRGTICLFSGGADSLVGIEYSKKKYGDITGVYSRHGNYRRLSPIIDKLERTVLNPLEIPLERVAVLEHPKGGYSQTRGLLYILSGAIYASIYNSNRIIMSECGQTIHQPKFGPLDDVTFTSHPCVTKASEKIINGFFNKKIAVLTPFENNTKAEMLKMFPSEQLNMTHSCISSRCGTECGFCYGCIIRRLSFLAVGLKDGNYINDVILADDTQKVTDLGRGGKGVSSIAKKSERLLALLRFSYDMLTDYKNMPDFSKERIEPYQKQDLFKRFALDNFAALYLVYEKEKIGKNKIIEKAYTDIRKSITKETLEKRLEQLDMGTYLPNKEKSISPS